MSDDTPTNPNRMPHPPVTVANAAENARLASISPTGTPIIPARFVPWLNLALLLGGIPASLSLVPGLAIPAVLGVAGGIVSTFAMWALSNSPGWRKP